MYENKSRVLIGKIELYRSIHKRLPDSIESLGEEETMSDGPFYVKVNNSEYMIYFGIGFDNYKVYHSKNQQWSNE